MGSATKVNCEKKTEEKLKASEGIEALQTKIFLTQALNGHYQLMEATMDCLF
ncbi:MAG: hypothetical protein ACLUR5_12475 [Eubacterium ventriosum]